MPRTRTKIKGLVVEWLGHSTIGIYGKNIIYIDPFSEILTGEEQKADLVISTHEHRDHFDVDAINKLTKSGTHVVVKSGTDTSNLSSELISELDIDKECTVENIIIKSIHAYNTKRFRSPGTPFHPEGFGMGVLVTVEGVKLYYAGDTDFIDPMTELAQENIDVAFLPIGGTYTMDIEEAVEAVKAIQPSTVIPVHFNHIKGTEADPQDFKQKISQVSQAEVVIL